MKRVYCTCCMECWDYSSQTLFSVYHQSVFNAPGNSVLQSILIKGGQYLEVLAKVKAVTFDKTGTLTEGRFGVTSIHCADGVSEKELMEVAASLEVHSTHPLGTAVAGSASAKGYNDWYVSWKDYLKLFF